MEDGGAGQAPVERRAWVALALVVVAVTLLPLAVTGANLAFATIEADFPGTSRSALSWVLTGYAIALAAFMLLAGQLADRLGARRVFLLGVTIFSLGALGSGLAPSPLWLIVGRIVQGAGGAVVMPASLAVVLPEFPPSRRPVAIAVWAASLPIGSSLAPTVTALILDVSDWRWVFLLPVPLTALVLVGGVVLLRETRVEGGGGPVDWLGVPIGTAAVGLIALAIVQGSGWGWTSPALLAVVAAAAVLVPVFVLRSRRHPRPLVDLDLFRVPTMRLASLANVVVSAAGLSVWLLWPLLLHDVWGWSLLATGIAISPAPLLAGTVSVLAGRRATRTGYRRPLIAGTLLLVAGNVWFIIQPTTTPSYWADVLPGLVLFGVAFGLTFAPLNGAALSEIGPERVGQANAAFQTIRNLSGALGIAMVVAVLGDGRAEDPLGPFDAAFGLLSAFAVAAAALVLVAWPKAATAPTGRPAADALVT